jgi:hypothetical protein
MPRKKEELIKQPKNHCQKEMEAILLFFFLRRNEPESIQPPRSLIKKKKSCINSN